MSASRLLTPLCSLLATASMAGPAAGWAAEQATALAALVQLHCVDCHNSELTEGAFDLTLLLNDELTPEEQGRVLKKMHRRVTAGEMPPREFGPLAPPERVRLSRALTGAFDRLSEQLRDDPGVVVMPRLTPVEYRNVIRDLSGRVVTDAGPYLSNEGDAGEGFANVGEAQSMTAAQLEKYIEGAKRALRHLRV